MSDGIEIHFDQKRARVELACEPEAFAPYRELIRHQLRESPEIAVDAVVEISVVDSAGFLARRGARGGRWTSVMFWLGVAVILTLALVGACAIIARLAA